MSSGEPTATLHVSVLRDEMLAALDVTRPHAVFLDCTLGGGGHSEAILRANPTAMLFALDRDAAAISRSQVRLAPYGARVEFAQGSFSDLLHIYQPRRFDGILADLGTSMDQLKGKRGFSFFDDSTLDMRMDESQNLTANEVVNNYAEKPLRKVLQIGGVGTEAAALARAIIRARPILTAKHLALVISDATPAWRRSETTHPATVPFQAIRIEVNDELAQIKDLLGAIPELINPEGRCAIITFHSLEDKLVTQTLRRWEQGGERSSVSRVTPSTPSLGRMLTKKPVVATDSERAANPASRSARLRSFKFLPEQACQQF